ncbi:kinase-like domain, phloem protein 2-like protein, partial [Tanacetum coccineum]
MYSFGIVMFELLCGRTAVINDDQDYKYLASLAITHYREKKLDEIIDWDLWKQMDSESFNIFAETAYDCLNEERSQRPNIDEIVPKLEKALKHARENKPIMSLPSNQFAHLKVPLESIISATNNFDKENIFGESGFAKEYKGQLLRSGELIDIHARRLDHHCSEVERQFWMEVSLLSTLKHKNLVSLIGFCDENDEKIIIYKLETRLNLSKYLSDPMLLTWVRRESVIDDQDNKYLALVATFHYKKKILDEMVDPVLWKQMDLQSFNVFAEIAYDCLSEERSQRPNIHEVVTRLESALKLQMERQNAEHSVVVAEVENTSSNHDEGSLTSISTHVESHVSKETKSFLEDLSHLKLSFQDIESATNNCAR